MLYTFSSADYSETQLRNYLRYAESDEAIVLWQDGVLLLLKYPRLFTAVKAPIYLLKIDVMARNIQSLLEKHINADNHIVKLIELDELISLTELHFPQLAL